MIPFILNLPYTLFGLFLAALLLPKEISWKSDPHAIIIRVRGKSFGINFKKKWRGMAVGHVVVLNPREEDKDLEHEIVHVRQFQKFPVIFPFLYYYELYKNGYRNNKYEEEAYSNAGNIYRRD